MTGLLIGKCYSVASILLVLSVNICDVESYAFTTQQKSNMFAFSLDKKFPCSITYSCDGYGQKAVTMKVSKGKSKHSKNNSLHTINNERKKLAGRRGTKNFVDPNKIFVGNLPFDADEDEVLSWLVDNLGGKMGKHNNIESFKLIRDWKTGKSKGFGFVNFMDPMYATSAMSFLKGKKLRGRFINLHQGKRKEQDKLLIVQKRDKKKAKQDEESRIIDAALDSAERLDEEEFDVGDFDSIDDTALFDDDDDDDFEYDGIFEETSKYEPLSAEESQDLNREQRRDKSRRKKRKKLPTTGFQE